MIDEIKNLRKKLHRNPELSGQEENTAQTIIDFITKHHPTEILKNIGGHGLAAIYEFGNNGPEIMIRCELDALPIQEINSFEHRSTLDNVSHKCGHDGHMAIVSGLIFWIKKQKFTCGKIILLFQPAEEIGKGAKNMLDDERFKTIKPNYVFALHNSPGVEMNKIILVENNFSASVQSLNIEIQGKECHASEPENGINPAVAVAEIINAFNALNIHDPNDLDFSIITPIHIQLGQQSYGVSPANAILDFTIRTWSEQKMEILKQKLIFLATNHCKKQKLEVKLNWIEYFPMTLNNSSCNNFIEKAASLNGYTLAVKDYPFKFGEDFGWFSQKYNAAMFGLGAGVKTPALHNADYDFPDDLLETGINMFTKIIEMILIKDEN